MRLPSALDSIPFHPPPTIYKPFGYILWLWLQLSFAFCIYLLHFGQLSAFGLCLWIPLFIVAIVSGHGPYVCAVVGGPIDPFVFELMQLEVEFVGAPACVRLPIWSLLIVNFMNFSVAFRQFSLRRQTNQNQKLWFVCTCCKSVSLFELQMLY